MTSRSLGERSDVNPLYVIQARMGSTRLPGKVLADLGGEPLLSFMLRRLSPLGLDNIVVATTLESRDDLVAELADAAGSHVIRGPEADVLARFGLALDRFSAQTLVRLTADCPLSDPDLVRAIVARHHETDADYTSNTLIRDFPIGLDVEVIRSSALRVAQSEATDGDEREHVTPFLYRRPERFRLASFRGTRSLGHESWTVDTTEDLERVRLIVSRLESRRASWEQIERVAETRAAPHGDGLWLRSAFPYEGSPWPVDDPARRVWAISEGTKHRGWVRLEVSAGKGDVSFHFDGQSGSHGSITKAVRALLGSNLQVQELSGDSVLRP